MALWKIKQTTPYEYPLCDGRPVIKHGDILCTPDNPHAETWYTVYWFYYCPPLDAHVAFIMYLEPYGIVGGGIKRLFFDADTLEHRPDLDASVPGGYSVFGEVWLNMTMFVESGAFGKCFMYNRWNFGKIFEVSPYNLQTFDGAWFIEDDDLPNCPDLSRGAPNGGIVNLQTGYLVLSHSSMLHFWKDLNTTPTYLGWLYAPIANLMDMAYENLNYCWAVGSQGTVMKIDYTRPRVELLSRINDPQAEGDRKYLLSFDPKRGRLVLFREKTDDPATGANRCTLEAYRPIPKLDTLTEPVPLDSLRVGKTIPFESFLVGDAGEGISPYRVQASLEDPGADGALLQSNIMTRLNGQVMVDYLAPASPATDTLTVTTEYTDGI
jgi:hypothetical protein